MSDSNMDRVLTVRLTIKDPEAAKWIWDAYPKPINGIVISALANGDVFQERDMFAQAAEFFIREEGEETSEAVDAHMDPFDTPEAAARDAKNNVSPGAKWDIVDRKGNVYLSGGTDEPRA